MSKYDMAWLLAANNNQERIKYLFFWGHQPQQDGRIGKGCLSQWWESDFEVDGIIYPSAEHWMMAQKARLFGDEAIWQQIITSKSPAQAKKLGRQVQNFDNTVWEEQRMDIVVQGSVHKFGQQEAMKQYLLQTGQRVLVEASPVDAIWGIGMAADHKNAYQPEAWQGPNLLGFALMEARDLLTQAID